MIYSINDDYHNIQVETPSGSNGETEAASVENLSAKTEEISTGDLHNKDIISGVSLTQSKDTSASYLEELQNLAADANIEVICSYIHTCNLLCCTYFENILSCYTGVRGFAGQGCAY